ncbi:Photosynthesis system II assembly factor YCF48, partial [Solimonas aquatica]
MREELDAISQRQRWCLGGLLIIWLLSLFAALNQAPRADLSQRNYELNPLRSNFWRNSMPAADFWAYPLESNPAERLTTIRGNLNSVHFVDAQHGWVVGVGGTIFTTADGGARWQAQASGSSAWLFSAHFVDAQHGWAVGDGGILLVTANGGARWQAQASGTSAALNSVHFVDAQHGWVVGVDGTILA